MQNMFDLTPLSTTEYPGKSACVIWFCGCNMRCIYCYNPQLMLQKGKFGVNELCEFLQARKKELDGVVFSGGECTFAKDFFTLLKFAKSLGYSVKIDTNGSNPEAIKQVLESNLADFIALDFKADAQNFKLITNTNFYEKNLQTLKILIENNANFEVRTTIHSDFLNENDIEKMAQILENAGYKGEYYLQNFIFTGEHFGCLEKPVNSFDPSKIKTNLKIKLRNF